MLMIKKGKKMYKVISLFSGTGGSSLGYKLAGFKVLMSNEFVEAAWKCYEANFPGTICLHEDIRKLTGDIILSKAGLKKGELDVLDGSPPCFEKNVLVMTDSGYKKIKDITISDKVLTHTNTFQQVEQTFKRKTKYIYEIKVAGTPVFKVTGNHPFYVRKKTQITLNKRWKNNRKKKIRAFEKAEWKLLENIDTSYYVGVAINKNKKLSDYKGITINQNQFEKNDIKVNSLPLKNKDFWWIIGRYLGDGWVRHEEYTSNKKNRYGFIICCNKNNNEKDIIIKKISKHFKYRLSERRTAFRIAIGSKELVYFVNQFGKGAKNKKLTSTIFNLPNSLLKEFLNGYFSADGCKRVSKSNISTQGSSSVSLELTMGIIACVHKVYKSFCSFSTPKRSSTHEIEGRTVNVSQSYGLRFDTNIDSRDEAFYENGYLWVPFRNKKKIIWNDYVYNLEVKKDQSYTIFNLIAHNCASFSTAGKREKKWGAVTAYSDVEQRVDDLLFEYSRILGEIQPKVFLVENVKGLVLGEAKKVFDKAKNEFEAKGYNVSSRLLNAKYFQVPQNRPRIIFIGVRKDLGVQPSHPKPQYAPIPIKDVLKGVVSSPQDIEDSKYPEHYSVMKYLKQMKPGESGADYNEKGSYFGLIRLDWNKPANTILQSDAKHISCSAIHPDEHRKLTIPELKRISSFPDDFKLLGDYKQNWERIGRAVPPNMMKAIAEHIRYEILDKINNIKNDYKPSYYNEELEKTGQLGFNFGDDFQKGFREYK